jgi:hypothetical protein
MGWCLEVNLAWFQATLATQSPPIDSQTAAGSGSESASAGNSAQHYTRRTLVLFNGTFAHAIPATTALARALRVPLINDATYDHYLRERRASRTRPAVYPPTLYIPGLEQKQPAAEKKQAVG